MDKGILATAATKVTEMASGVKQAFEGVLSADKKDEEHCREEEMKPVMVGEPVMMPNQDKIRVEEMKKDFHLGTHTYPPMLNGNRMNWPVGPIEIPDMNRPNASQCAAEIAQDREEEKKILQGQGEY